MKKQEKKQEKMYLLFEESEYDQTIRTLYWGKIKEMDISNPQKFMNEMMPYFRRGMDYDTALSKYFIDKERFLAMIENENQYLDKQIEMLDLDNYLTRRR